MKRDEPKFDYPPGFVLSGNYDSDSPCDPLIRRQIGWVPVTDADGNPARRWTVVDETR